MSKKKQSRSKHIPQRTCIACGQKTDKRRLTRIVHTKDAGVIIDASGKQNGRGAYICNQLICWDKVTQTRLLDQKLRTHVTVTEKEAIAQQKPSDVA